MEESKLFTADEFNSWKDVCTNQYKDYPIARILLLKKYPPFLSDLEQLTQQTNLSKCFNTETTATAAAALNYFQEKWDVEIKIEKDFFTHDNPHNIKLIPKFAAYQVIPSGNIEEDGYWMNNRAKDTMIFEVYLKAPLPLIIKTITDKINEFSPEKEKPPIQLRLGDLPIWSLFVAGIAYNNPDMIYAYKKYNDDKSEDSLVADRLRGEKGRFEALRQFIDPNGHGADWNPGEC